jgi:hypothetical protein
MSYELIQKVEDITPRHKTCDQPTKTKNKI